MSVHHVRSEEKACRFCYQDLPEWKDTLTPSDLKSKMDQGTAMMAVVFKDKVRRNGDDAGGVQGQGAPQWR